MKYPLAVCYVTARENPETPWFIRSLVNQNNGESRIVVFVVDSLKENRSLDFLGCDGIRHVEPKPSYWSGKSRLTKDNWWTVANSRNTALCLCDMPWLAFLDDRSVLMPGWLDAINEAMQGNYIVAGAYQKRTAMTVEGGVIKNAGIVTGEDSREEYVLKGKHPVPFPCPGQWLFGCNLAMPLEWALEVNGYSETLTDSLSFEDVPFGLVLENNGFPIKYDPRMKIIEDRTPELCAPVIRRTDKGVSPNDKSHKVLEIIRGVKKSPNPFDLRLLRAHVQAGNPFPPPSRPATDWYDGMPIQEFDKL